MQENNQEPIGGLQQVAGDFRSHTLRRQAVPLSTTNLFQVSNIQPLRAHQIIVASENTPRTLGRDFFPQQPHVPSGQMKANIRDKAPPLLAQQLYHPANLQPSTDYEFVKEMSLRPRTKASPRAAAFLKKPRNNAFTAVSKSAAVFSSQLHEIVDSDVAQKFCLHNPKSSIHDQCIDSFRPQLTRTKLVEDSFCDVGYLSTVTSKSAENLLSPDNRAVSAISFAASGDEQRSRAKQKVSLVDIRYTFINYSCGACDSMSY